MAQEIYLLQEDKVVRPVTDPEWTRQEGDNDCDLEPSGPNHSTIRVVRSLDWEQDSLGLSRIHPISCFCFDGATWDFSSLTRD